MKSHRLPDMSRCPLCGYQNTGTMGVDHDLKPVAGDRSICIECAGVSIFSDDHTLRKATTEELKEAMANPDIVRGRAAIKKLWKEWN